MPYPTYQDYLNAHNNTGLEGMFLYVNNVVPAFMGLMLFALFIIILLASFFSQKRLTGKGDFPASLVAASFITMIASALLSLIAGMLSTYILAITISVFIISLIVLFATRE